jgi:hypothetical protein
MQTTNTTPAAVTIPTITQIHPDYYGPDNYGGARAMIGGREVSFGSVRGYAIYNLGLWNKYQGPEAMAKAEAAGQTIWQWVSAKVASAEQRATERHDKLQWINVSATVISADAGFYERQEVRRAAMPRLQVGDIVDFEGKLSRIENDHNRNYKLVPVGL